VKFGTDAKGTNQQMNKLAWSQYLLAKVSLDAGFLWEIPGLHDVRYQLDVVVVKRN